MSSPREATTCAPNPERSGERIVLEDLRRFGPDSNSPAPSLVESLNYCKSLTKRHYENFSVGSLLVPVKFRQDMFNIYAYCRWSDDLADETGSSDEAMRLLTWWRREMVDCFDGNARHPVFVALRSTIVRYNFTPAPFLGLLDAFVQDQLVKRYDTDEQLIGYCRGSANPVGRMVLQIAGVLDPSALIQSDQICTGLQIANFCQDMRRDAERGRIYMPRERWSRNDVSEKEILDAKPSSNLRNALSDWVKEARSYLIDGLPLVKTTPRWLARDLQLFVRGGLTILENITRANFNIWESNIEVTKRQKMKLILRAMFQPRSTAVLSPVASSQSSRA